MSLWTDFIGAELLWVAAADVPTRVVRAGEGDPPIVLMHGRGGHLESWRANVRALARERRVVAFDLLGHGLTGRHDGDYRVVDLTDHAIATLEALALGPCVLVGQSIGGWIAAWTALRRPDLVDSLVLVEPAGLQSEPERLRDPKVAAAFERGGRAFLEPSSEAVRTRLLGLVGDPASIDEELVETRRLLYAPAEARSVHRRVRAADNAAELLTPDVLQRLDARVLVIHGACANTPDHVLERAVAAAGATLHTLAGTKQWPQLERPEQVNRLITEFATREESPCPSG
jgi:2-hydroxy-6-oxonona-2,4-dienedioate hydrolase